MVCLKAVKVDDIRFIGASPYSQRRFLCTLDETFICSYKILLYDKVSHFLWTFRSLFLLKIVRIIVFWKNLQFIVGVGVFWYFIANIILNLLFAVCIVVSKDLLIFCNSMILWWTQKTYSMSFSEDLFEKNIQEAFE